MTLTEEQIKAMTTEEIKAAIRAFREIEDEMKKEWWHGTDEFRKEVMAIAGIEVNGDIFDKIIFQNWRPLIEELDFRDEEERERQRVDKLDKMTGDILYVVLRVEVDGPYERYSSRVSVETTVELITKDRDTAYGYEGLSNLDVTYKVIRAKEGFGGVDTHFAGYGHSE